VIACGYAWTAEPGWPYKQKDVVVVGRGDRAHLDELVRLAPNETARQQIIEFFRPLAEGRPEWTGCYVYGRMDRPDVPPPKLTHLWWKPVDKVLP
jgi:hypothetical protein